MKLYTDTVQMAGMIWAQFEKNPCDSFKKMSGTKMTEFCHENQYGG